jgi:uncharacterized protein (DUF1778 family)
MADLGRTIRAIPASEIQSALRRTARLNLLVTPQQKAEVRAAADRYGLSMTEYLLRLHALVEARVGRPSRRG